MTRQLRSPTAFAALASALGLAAAPALAQQAAPAGGGDRYRPEQSIAYDFGSKSVSGYFVAEAGRCQLVLMIGGRIDVDAAFLPSPVRVRVVLAPGEVAGLDSEEGRSLNLACGEDAASLVVTGGSTEELVLASCEGRTGCRRHDMSPQ